MGGKKGPVDKTRRAKRRGIRESKEVKPGFPRKQESQEGEVGKGEGGEFPPTSKRKTKEERSH